MEQINNTDKEDLRPFWYYFPSFFSYLKQDKLFYFLLSIAIAHLLLLLPLGIIGSLIKGLLFLVVYKIAFEVLVAISTGEFEYKDSFSLNLSSFMGLKAMVLVVLQALVLFFVLPENLAFGLVLLFALTFVFPAFLMRLSQSQSIASALNPLAWLDIMGRIGKEYTILSLFYFTTGLLKLAIDFFLISQFQPWLNLLISSLLFNFVLVFLFLIIGFVMYRHSGILDIDTLDTETVSSEEMFADPVKQRILDLMPQNKPEEVINIIEEVKKQDTRVDLDSYLSIAHDQLLHKQRHSPKQKLQDLMENNNMLSALKLCKEYLQDGHAIKPDQVESLSKLIKYAYDKQQYGLVIKLSNGMEKSYKDDHQEIVNNYFLVAQIMYQQNKKAQTRKLLTSLINKYQKTANTAALSSYLKGMDLKSQSS